MTVKSRHRNNSSSYDISADVEKIKAALFDTTQDLKGRAGEMFTDSINTVKDRTEMLSDNLIDYTSQKPFKALGIALLAGVVLGVLIGRK